MCVCVCGWLLFVSVNSIKKNCISTQGLSEIVFVLWSDGLGVSHCLWSVTFIISATSNVTDSLTPATSFITLPVSCLSCLPVVTMCWDDSMQCHCVQKRVPTWHSAVHQLSTWIPIIPTLLVIFLPFSQTYHAFLPLVLQLLLSFFPPFLISRHPSLSPMEGFSG